MEDLPKGCRARYEEITNRAEELIVSFANGNRMDTVKTLESMESTRIALAVLSEMIKQDSSLSEDLNRFLKEVA
jgi:hypothetical protein